MNYMSYLFLKPVPDPESFGIAWIDSDGRIVNMQEKPAISDSNLAITGLYLYPPLVFDMIEEILSTTGYSNRGELEITDINRLFMQKDSKQRAENFDSHWADCGTIDALLETSVIHGYQLRRNEMK